MNHLAIIADGNRRWAKANSMPIEAGYIQGLTTIENCCDWAIANNVQYVTVYCFSTENWGRPREEVNLLINLSKWYFKEKCDWYVSAGIKVQFSGRRDRVDQDLVEMLIEVEKRTSKGKNMILTICADYGGRDEIIRAIESGAKTEKEISDIISSKLPDPDVILRTGGEHRLSNFLLWQSAYAELFFLDAPFPALEFSDLDTVMQAYTGKKRNYGR